MKLNLNQPRAQFWYSVALVIFIPASIVAGTVWLSLQLKQNFDLELRRKANLGAEVFGVSVGNILASNSQQKSAQLLATLIDQTRTQAPEISLLSVSVPSTSGYQLLASSNVATNGQPDTSIQTQLAWSKASAVASLIAAGESQTRQWLVASPVVGPSGALAAIVTIRVDLRSSDALINSTLRQSAIMLAVLMVVIIALMLNHFRFVQYAELFRKQRELDRMKDDFISIATHELKAPMSVIKGYISMALEEKLEPGVRSMLSTGFEQTDRLGRLVSDLLDVSRIEQGRTKYRLEPLNLRTSIRSLIDNFSVKANEKKLGLAYNPQTDLPPVMADPDRVSEIFTNLIDNAIKYSRTGTVTISHTVTATSIQTVVADTGIGLAPEEITKLFQRFYRARNSDTLDIAGTGLGLWIIKQYAEGMGGTITVSSVKGQGSQFQVTLPIAKTPLVSPK